jgi:hypothetical protein
MNCKEAEKKMLFYYDNELAATMANSLKLHLADCTHCAALYENIKVCMQSINTDKQAEEDFYFYTRLKQRLENKKRNAAISNMIPKQIMQAIAISCLLAIGIFTGIKIGLKYDTNNALTEETRTSQLSSYSQDTYIADVSNEQIESLYTSNQ